MPLLLAFIALPLIEIALFVIVGGEIGVLGVLAAILGTMLLGMAIMRGQQARFAMVRQGLLRLSPGTLLAEGAFRMMAALFLIIPGFLTDALGLILLIPPLQRLIVASIAARAQVRTVHAGAGRADGDIIDGEFEVRETTRDPLDPSHRLDDPHR